MSSDPKSLYAMKRQLEVALDIVQRHMADEDSLLGFGPVDHILIQALRVMEGLVEKEFRAGLRAKSDARSQLEVVRPEAG